MQSWMHVTRINAIGKYNVSIDASKINSELESKVPNNIQAIAHNYNHLHEQPTVFYAVALALAVVGDNHPYTIKAAWTYVGLRVGHSLYQVFVNRVLVSCLSFFFLFRFLFSGGDRREDGFGLTFRVIDTLSNLLEQFGCRCWAVGSSCDACVLESCLRVRKGGEIGEGWLYDLVLSIQEIFCLYH